MHTGLIMTVTGPSGTGKNTISQELLAADPKLQYFVTATTREPRAYEKEGVDYYFLTQETFLTKIDAGDFIEWSNHYGNYYGALKEEVRSKIKAGIDPVSDITWTGAREMKKSFPDEAVSILLLPPSLEALDERMAKRRESSKETDMSQMKRVEKMRVDMKHWQEDGYVFTNEDMKGSTLSDYDHIVINNDLDATIEEIHNIIADERQKRLK